MQNIFSMPSMPAPVNEAFDQDWEIISDSFSVMSIDSFMLIDASEDEVVAKAYYDQTLKRWIFPDDEVEAKVAKPLAPLPTKTGAQQRLVAPPEPNDPLATLMSPPPHPGMPNKKCNATKALSLQVPPKFAVFKPKLVDASQKGADRKG